MNSTIKKTYFYFSLGIISIFIFWLFASIFARNNYILPDPILTIKALGELLTVSRTYLVLGTSLSRLLVAILISLLIAILTGSISLISKTFKGIIGPWISLIKTLPLAVVIILFLVYFKANLSVYFIVGVVVYPLVYEGFMASFKMLDKDLLAEIKMLGNINFYIVKKVFIPLTLPNILTTLIQGFGLGFKVLVMAEYIAEPNNSIGKELLFYKEHLVAMEYVFAWAMIIIAVVIVFEFIVKLIQNKVIEGN
jgi:NitT/TauT family transport system permease protein